MDNAPLGDSNKVVSSVISADGFAESGSRMSKSYLGVPYYGCNGNHRMRLLYRPQPRYSSKSSMGSGVLR